MTIRQLSLYYEKAKQTISYAELQRRVRANNMEILKGKLRKNKRDIPDDLEKWNNEELNKLWFELDKAK